MKRSYFPPVYSPAVRGWYLFRVDAAATRIKSTEAVLVQCTSWTYGYGIIFKYCKDVVEKEEGLQCDGAMIEVFGSISTTNNVLAVLCIGRCWCDDTHSVDQRLIGGDRHSLSQIIESYTMMLFIIPPSWHHIRCPHPKASFITERMVEGLKRLKMCDALWKESNMQTAQGTTV